MAIDKVRPLKLETPDEGGFQTDVFPTEIDPSEDYIVPKGIAFEDSDVETLDLSSDINVQTLSFASVLLSKAKIPDDLKNYIVSEDHQLILFDNFTIDGYTTVNGDIVIL